MQFDQAILRGQHLLLSGDNSSVVLDAELCEGAANGFRINFAAAPEVLVQLVGCSF